MLVVCPLEDWICCSLTHHRHTSFYAIFIFYKGKVCGSPALSKSIGTIFSNSTCPHSISVSYLGNSLNTSAFSLLWKLMVICAQWSLTLYAMLSHFSHVRPFSPLWTIAHQAPLSVGFSRQEYQSGLSCPPPGDLPDPGIKPTSLKSPALAGRFFFFLAGRFFTTSTTWEAPIFDLTICKKIKAQIMICSC